MKKYFPSQNFAPENELTYFAAIDRGSYVVCYYRENTPDFAEIVRQKDDQAEIRRVVYYKRSWPDEAVLNTHLTHYACPFDLVAPEIEKEQCVIGMVYHCNNKGQLQFIDEIHMDKQGNYLKEIRKNKDDLLTGTIEYEYNDDGELLVTRERNAAGVIISECIEY